MCNCADKPHSRKEIISKNISVEKDTITINESIVIEEEQIKEGFLFVDIGKIHFNGGYLNILEENKKDTIITFDNKQAYFKGKSYESIEESGFYQKSLNTVAFDPEYSLFILECIGLDNGYHEVIINGKSAYINNNKYKSYLEFKTVKKYILESYPILSVKHPLKQHPNNDSPIIEGYLNFTYLPIEIKGDWLKVKDDKDCFIDEPSKKDLLGWVRWRKDGKIIIDIGHIC